MRLGIIVLAAAAALGCCAGALRADGGPPSLPDRLPLGKYMIFPAEKRAEVRATVCLNAGILDFYAATENSGKEYETVLTLDGTPRELHAALMVIGARPGAMPPEFTSAPPVAHDKAIKSTAPAPMEKEAAPAKPGSRVRMTVRWKDARGEHTAPAEAWLIDRATKRPPENLEWVFTGSFFGKGSDGKEVYVADLEKTAIGCWYHHECVLNAASAAGNPYKGDALGYEVNAAAIPKVGTEVRVSFILK